MQNIKLFLATIVGSIALIVGLGWFLSRLTTPEAVPVTATNAELLAGARHMQGAAEAPFTVVEFSDFQCPACAAQAPVMKSLLAQYPQKIKFVYRHFPLTSIHPHAVAAARASEAAAKQGKFWEFHDKLFTTQAEWSDTDNPDSIFTRLAQEVGLNLEEYQAAYASQETLDLVNADRRLAETLSLNSTPTFIVNGTVMDLGTLQQQLGAEPADAASPAAALGEAQPSGE